MICDHCKGPLPEPLLCDDCYGDIGGEMDAALREALTALATWPESTPEHPSITSQDVAMRAFAKAALAGAAREGGGT